MKTVYGFILTDSEVEHDASIGVVITKEGQEVLHPERIKNMLLNMGGIESMRTKYDCPVDIEVEPKIRLVDGVVIGGFTVGSQHSNTHLRLAEGIKEQNPEWTITLMPKDALAVLIRNNLACPTMETVGNGMDCIYKKVVEH